MRVHKNPVTAPVIIWGGYSPMMTSHNDTWPGFQTCIVISQFPTRGQRHEYRQTSSDATCDWLWNLHSWENCPNWCSVYMRNPWWPWEFVWRSHMSCEPCKVKVNTSWGHPVWVSLNETCSVLKSNQIVLVKISLQQLKVDRPPPRNYPHTPLFIHRKDTSTTFSDKL